jgi:hypothetical protein
MTPEFSVNNLVQVRWTDAVLCGNGAVSMRPTSRDYVLRSYLLNLSLGQKHAPMPLSVSISSFVFSVLQILLMRTLPDMARIYACTHIARVKSFRSRPATAREKERHSVRARGALLVAQKTVAVWLARKRPNQAFVGVMSGDGLSQPIKLGGVRNIARMAGARFFESQKFIGSAFGRIGWHRCSPVTAVLGVLAA